MKIEDMTIEQIEEYIINKYPETNLYMRCLECDEYYPLNEMDINLEVCKDCQNKDDEE